MALDKKSDRTLDKTSDQISNKVLGKISAQPSDNISDNSSGTSSGIIGLDIGGANTKLASADGTLTELHYLPLWKNTELPRVLGELASRLQPEKLAVVMTGELADCFEDKTEGIRFIMENVEEAFGKEKVSYINSKGHFFKTGDSLRSLAAANWAASARLIGAEFGDCLFVDVGSTTSDLIPILGGEPRAGLSDFSRLLRKELLYAGTLRTNLAALLEQVEFKAGSCCPSSELFATTADVYLLLGDISKEQFSCETADGAGKSRSEAMRRLARVVCADLSEISESEILELARQAKEKQITKLENAISEVAGRHGLTKVVSAGLGEFMIQEAAKRLGLECVSVAEYWGALRSKVFPAYAAAKLLEQE
ncbi:MAG: hydantoinase/oxoprolinase family protein [Methanosarcinaceae archaeon]|nr:hydantoinase/oxoprolinase family protein [Methanosarcinaceae archaeon]MDD4331861.1 hydantoinase/oxoprolinase family protein [Methanosarcinaceae archaeon]MDD4749775.1 hydantoinase/oxoprolinase family protein [Methanosarcinaceae archaeon]